MRPARLTRQFLKPFPLTTASYQSHPRGTVLTARCEVPRGKSALVRKGWRRSFRYAARGRGAAGAKDVPNRGRVPGSSHPNPTVDALRQGLQELGYVEGENAILVTRFGDGRTERLPELVVETISLQVDVLVVGSTLGALAAKKATATVPVVFAGLYDPVTPGIVASLARPGGNITGASMGVGGSGFAQKWVELLKEALPGISHIAVLSNLASPLSHRWCGRLRRRRGHSM